MRSITLNHLAGALRAFRHTPDTIALLCTELHLTFEEEEEVSRIAMDNDPTLYFSPTTNKIYFRCQHCLSQYVEREALSAHTCRKIQMAPRIGRDAIDFNTIE